MHEKISHGKQNPHIQNMGRIRPDPALAQVFLLPVIGVIIAVVLIRVIVVLLVLEKWQPGDPNTFVLKNNHGLGLRAKIRPDLFASTALTHFDVTSISEREIKHLYL